MAAKTEYAYLSGKCKWAKTLQPDKFGNWSVQLYMDDKAKLTWMDLKKKGILNESRSDVDGDFVSLRRKTERIFKDGRKVGMTPVAVTNKDGTPFNGSIGNGSDITCKIEVYSYRDPFKAGVLRFAIRLIAIRIDNLVEFNPENPNSFDPDVAKMVEGLKDAPEPLF